MTDLNREMLLKAMEIMEENEIAPDPRPTCVKCKESKLPGCLYDAVALIPGSWVNEEDKFVYCCELCFALAQGLSQKEAERQREEANRIMFGGGL